ncbi:MAG: metal ABC transporter permease [Planktomarina sp.]
MLDDFMARAVLAGIGLALAAAPLGCFIVWRRMAYFGDATSHAALLGVALALALNISITAGVLIVALGLALFVQSATRAETSADSLLGVAAHAGLAFGLVGISLLSNVRVDPMSFLFGDILAVSKTDLATIWGGALAVLAVIAWRWGALLLATLNPELSRASGLNPNKEAMILTLSLALVVAISIKVVGALLITAMLIIPAAAARPLSRSPEQMGVLAFLIGTGSALGGIWVSYLFDTVTGPTIVSVAVLFFAATTVAGIFIKK